MKQTAVDWLIEEIEKLTGLQYLHEEDCAIKAKEMEKENALRFGAKCCIMTTQKNDWTLENLYNETFN
jgi:hypothetical protein